MKIRVLTLRCVIGLILLCGMAAGAERDWVQMKATIRYERTGTIATTAEGSFTYRLDATIEQVMARAKRKGDNKYSKFSLPSGYTRSFRSNGITSLTGEVTQKEAVSGKTYTATMDLHGEIGTKDDLQLEEVQSGAPLGDGYMAKLTVSARLKGIINSTYPLIPNSVKADTVLLWPTPVRNDPELGLVSAGDIMLYPVLGPRPKEESEAMLYDVVASIDQAPGMGALRPPAVGAVTTGLGGAWTLALEKRTNLKVMETADGHYTDAITVAITLVPLTLPIPAKKEN